MKITKSKIMEIIREEINKLQEATWARSGAAQPSPSTEKPPATSDIESGDPRRWPHERTDLEGVFRDFYNAYHEAKAADDEERAKASWAEAAKIAQQLKEKFPEIYKTNED
jgi:hypothetical protein